MTTIYPTAEVLQAIAEEHGYRIDSALCCSIQGVVIDYSRPKREGETFIGLPLAGERVDSEVIERHYCPQVEAPREVEDVTWGRAIQRVIWEIEADATPFDETEPA